MIHRHLYRARLGLLAAALFSAALISVEFPLQTLLHQRAAVRTVSSQLAALDARNAAIANNIRALKQPSTIAEIAHEEYGLVEPGQLSYVILPAQGSSDSGSLGPSEIPPRDLVAQQPLPVAAPPVRATPGLWQRFLQRLEFWHPAG